MPSYSVSVFAPISSVVTLVYFPPNPVASLVFSNLVFDIVVFKTWTRDSSQNTLVILIGYSEVYGHPSFTYIGTSSGV